ncbi:MAG: nucleoside-diphosphate sugar epimerase/dehydratase [Pseudomonadota bacterium]
MLGFIQRLSPLQKQAIFLGLDGSLVLLSLFLAVLIQTGAAPQIDVVSVVPPLGVLLILTLALASLLRLPTTKLNAYESGGLGKLAGLAAVLTLCAWALGTIGELPFAHGVYIVFGLVFFLSAALLRIAMLQIVLTLYRNDASRCRVLIYGAGNTGLQLAQALKAHNAIVPVAFADDNPALHGRYVSGLPVIKPSRISSFAAERGLDRVLLAMPSLSAPKRMLMARRLQGRGLDVQALPSFAQLIGQEIGVDQFSSVLPAHFLGRAQVDGAFGAEAAHFTDRTVLVSGAGGSIGSELCRQILAFKPSKIVLYELSELALNTIESELRDIASEGVEICGVLGSVTDARLVKMVLNRYDVDVIIHAAAYKHVPLVEANLLVGLANNVLGTATLARAAFDAEVERFILVSSDKAVRPTNVMGASKRLAEMVVQDLANRSTKTIFAMVRFGNVLGSSGSVIPLFQEQISRGGPVTLTHRDVTRYFMTVQEAVRLVLRSATFARGGEVFVLDMGQPVPIAQIARKLIEMAGCTVKDAEHPEGDIEIAIVGLRPGEKLEEELLIGEGHLTTSDEKIFAAREVRLSEIEVASMLRSLRAAVGAADETAALAVVARWVEGWPDRAPHPVEAK